MHLVLVAVMLAAPAPKLEPFKKVPLLGGRITMRVAAAAKDSPRPPEDLMSPDRPVEGETRIVTDLPGGRLVFYVKELYRLASDTDAPLMKYMSEEKPDAHVIVETVDKLKLVRQAPWEWKEVIDGGELVESALVVLPDHTVVKAGFFVSPAVKDKSKLRPYAISALKTLEYVSPLRTGGELTVAGVAVSLPASWVHEAQRGPDFSVHRFFPLWPWADAAEAPSVGLYEGGHPSWMSDQTGSKDPVKEEAGRWLGQDTKWRVSGEFHEAMAGTGLARLHVWYSGAKAKAVVDGMKLTAK